MDKDKQKTLRNLKKAYKFLLEESKNDPTIKEEFDMKSYGVFVNLSVKDIGRHRILCQTYGCLLGHIAKGFKIDKKHFIEHIEYSYDLFGFDKFPALYDKIQETGDAVAQNHLWRFLFSANWNNYQPTFEQAMQRLKYIIDYKLDIPDWNYTFKSFIKE